MTKSDMDSQEEVVQNEEREDEDVLCPFCNDPSCDGFCEDEDEFDDDDFEDDFDDDFDEDDICPFCDDPLCDGFCDDFEGDCKQPTR